MEKERVIYFDFLRIFAAFAVVVLHTSAQNFYKVNVFSLKWSFFNIGDSVVRWGVPIFVMISGALFLGQETIDIKSLYAKNIKHLFVSFVVWSLICVIVEKIQNPTMTKGEMVQQFIKGHFHLWFLWMLIGIYMMLPLLNEIVKNTTFVKYFLLLALVFASILPTIRQLYESFRPFISDERILTVINALFKNVTVMNVCMVFGYTGYFVLGYYLNNIEINLKAERIIYALAVIGFASTILLTAYFSRKTGTADTGFYNNMRVNVLLESIGIFTFFKCRISKINVKHKERLTFLSKCSFGCYLVHTLVLQSLSRYYGINTKSLPASISVVVIAAVVFILSYFISIILNRIPFVKKYFV